MEKTLDEVKARVEGYVEMVSKLNDGAVIEAEYGRKFARIVQYNGGKSVHTFIDLKNGDVLKAATFHQPVKNNVRSNIFADDFGASGVTKYGAVYLK